MRRETRYCRACWRDEVHIPVKAPSAVRIVALVFTLGLANWLWPYRCACCGKMRVRGTEGH